MNHNIVPEEVLDALRTVGDPALPPPGDVFAKTQAKGFLHVPALMEVTTRPVPDPSIAAAIAQVSPDADKVEVASRLFARYGTEISGALLLAALPQAYAAVWGSRVLTATAALQHDFRRRIVRTAQFLLIVMRKPKGGETFDQLWPTDASDLERSSAPEDTRPWEACLAIRRFHESVRQQIGSDSELIDAVGPENETPLNQEDLLGMLLSFTVTVFEVLEQFGIRWSADEQEAYLHVWDLVGAHLGVGSKAARSAAKAQLATMEVPRGRIPPRMLAENQQGWIGLRPVSISDTRLLLDQLRRRQWPPAALVSEDDGDTPGTGLGGNCRSGRLLMRALLNELAASMPPKSRPLALSVVRRLAPLRVRERLNLGGGGILLSMLDLPLRSVGGDPCKVVPGANPVSTRVTRMMANEVTMRAMVRFLRTESLFMPGLAEWSRDLIDPMEEGIA